MTWVFENCTKWGDVIEAGEEEVQAEHGEDFNLYYEAWALELEQLVEAGKCDCREEE